MIQQRFYFLLLHGLAIIGLAGSSLSINSCLLSILLSILNTLNLNILCFLDTLDSLNVSITLIVSMDTSEWRLAYLHLNSWSVNWNQCWRFDSMNFWSDYLIWQRRPELTMYRLLNCRKSLNFLIMPNNISILGFWCRNIGTWYNLTLALNFNIPLINRWT